MFNILSPFIGIGILTIGIMGLYYLGTKDDAKESKKSRLILPEQPLKRKR